MGKRTQNIFCPHPTKKMLKIPPLSYTPNSTFRKLIQDEEVKTGHLFTKLKYFITPTKHTNCLQICWDFVSILALSNSFGFQIGILKKKTNTNLPSTIPPGLGSLPSKASDKSHEYKPEKEKPTTPGNRPTSPYKSLYNSVRNSPGTLEK